VKINLVFDDWRDERGNSVYNTIVGLDLTCGDLHSGTTFEANIALDADTEEQLRRAVELGFRPTFLVSLSVEKMTKDEKRD